MSSGWPQKYTIEKSWILIYILFCFNYKNLVTSRIGCASYQRSKYQGKYIQPQVLCCGLNIAPLLLVSLQFKTGTVFVAFALMAPQHLLLIYVTRMYSVFARSIYHLVLKHLSWLSRQPRERGQRGGPKYQFEKSKLLRFIGESNVAHHWNNF